MEYDKITTYKIKEDNYKVFALLSNYLNHAPDFIKGEEISEIAQNGVSSEYAFKLLLASAFGLDIVDNMDDKELFNKYFDQMIHQLDANIYYNNPYYKNIKIPTIKIGNSELKYENYKPFEGFVCNDIFQTEEGRQIPQVGFFDTEFMFPAILENDRIWMTITPNEIETMKEAVDQAFGSVLTYGLGLGYYTYMVSEKDNVESVTVVEMNEDVIHLFKKNVLPQFRNAHKINIIQADAFEFAGQHMTQGNYDFVFTDLWHDVSDGIDMYLKMKSYEKQSPDTVFTYWIEKSILCYC
ncbi:Polyamine aminopropyltransferase [compost metagenome]